MSNSALAGQAIIDFPSGMIMPYAGAAIPSGWLECNGAEIDISAYPKLSAALGSTWNTAKNPLTGATYAAPAAGKFRVPDMRGAFLRGSSSGANNAQGVATGLAEFQAHKTAKNGLSNGGSNTVTGTAAGQSFSGTANVKTGGSGQDYYSSGNNIAPTNFVADSYAGSYVGLAASNAGFPIYTPLNHTHGSSSLTATAAAPTISSTDTETRPDSVGVRYLIKA